MRALCDKLAGPVEIRARLRHLGPVRHIRATGEWEIKSHLHESAADAALDAGFVRELCELCDECYSHPVASGPCCEACSKAQAVRWPRKAKAKPIVPVPLTDAEVVLTALVEHAARLETIASATYDDPATSTDQRANAYTEARCAQGALARFREAHGKAFSAHMGLQAAAGGR